MQKIRTVRDERLAKYQQEDATIVRESEAYRAMIAAGYRFEMLRNQRLAEQSEALGLIDTAYAYRADAKRFEELLANAQ